jgi:hypothetical protein
MKSLRACYELQGMRCCGENQTGHYREIEKDGDLVMEDGSSEPPFPHNPTGRANFPCLFVTAR